MTTTERPAQPGETCDCGDPARTVYVTEKFGEVPSCGVQHRSAERVVVIPEVTIPATNAATAQRVRDLLDEIGPALNELHAAALELREEYHQALIALYPYLGGGYDEVHELAGKVTGWSEVWELIMGTIGDRFGDGGELEHQELTNDQIAERAQASAGAR